MTENRDIVYLFGFSETMGKQLERLLPLLKAQLSKSPKIDFILIHDGVIGTSIKGKIPESLNELLEFDIKIHAMIPDLKARGIDINHVHKKIAPIEYKELVDILDNSQKIISWI